MDWNLQRDKMVDEQIIARGISDPDVLAAMRKIERHLFVPQDLRAHAYQDNPLPIGYGATISQPYIVAFMTEALHLTKESKVLEIGTGCGYQTAVLAEIAKEVYSIEIIATLADAARERLEALSYRNIYVRCGDGYYGWPEGAPFDAVIVTAAAPQIPETIFQQLKEGGWLVSPVGDISQILYLVTKQNNHMKITKSMCVSFVPMRHEET